MSEYPQDHAPEIGMNEIAPALKKLAGGVLLAGLVFCPGITSVSAGICLL
jgi:hypothetical protein